MRSENLNDAINNSNTNTSLSQTEVENNKSKESKGENESKKEEKKITENVNQDINLDDLKEKDEDVCDDDNLKENLLNKNDFISAPPQKRSFWKTRYIKRIVLIFIYIISYIYSAIYIRLNSLDLIPIKASFIQGAIFSIFIPISFFVSSNRNFKKNKKYMNQEKEVLNIEIENNMKDGLSDFMNKKYYEVYYYYISKFYFLTAFFSVLYFLSIYFFHLGVSYTQPLLGQLFFPFISLILIIIKIIDDKRRICNIFKVISIICILTISFLFMVSFIKNNDISLDSNFIYSIIFLGIFALIQSVFIFFLKKVFKKYFYYVDVLEFVGYMGIYIMVIVPLILVILYALFYSELINNNPSGNILFYLLGKAFVSTCICDLTLAYILKYFCLKITCKLMVINLSIIYFIFYIVTAPNKMINDYYFLIGQILNLVIIGLLIRDIYKKNIKREIYEINKQKIRASL